jgi:hypothetical protein
MGGMISVVIFGLLMVPVFFVSVLRFFSRERSRARAEEVPGSPARQRG